MQDRSAVCFFSANIAVEQEVIVAAIVIGFLYLHASGVHQHTFSRSRVATLLLDIDFRSGPSTKLLPM